METFKEIEAFIRKAMEKGYAVRTNEKWHYHVESDTIHISFAIYNTSLHISYSNPNQIRSLGSKAIETNLTDREKASLEVLHCDVNDYEANRVDYILDNFFKEDKLITVNDLDFD